MKSWFCELFLSCVLAAPVGMPVADLTYGTVLFEYFQDNYQDALLRAEVAELQGRTGEDVVRFQLARGSFAFSDGMYTYASETFASVGDEELTDIDRMRLAFHLAREHHRRGSWSELEGQLTQIDLGETWRGKQKSHPEVEYMRSELAIQRGDLAAADTGLELLDETDPLRAYGLYNLGVAYRQADDLDNAWRTFNTLANTPAYSDEAYDLSQRAKLALSFIARSQHAVGTTALTVEAPRKGRWWLPFDGGGRKKQDEAIGAAQILGALPGSGRYRDIALAAYGGLAMDAENYPLAARIWLTLGNQEYWNTSTATARLGYPMTLERLASTEMALVKYREAETAFATRLAALDQLEMYTDTTPPWIAALLDAFAQPQRDPERIAEMMSVWRERLGHTEWLEWLSTEQINTLLQEWRQLRDMQAYLAQLPRELDALKTASEERRERSAQAREMMLDNGLVARREALNNKVLTLAYELAQVENSIAAPTREWLQLLTTPDERELLDDLFAKRERVERHMSPRDQNKWLPRIDRLIGTVYFDVVADRSSRTRARAKTLSESRLLLADVDERIARVQTAEDEYVAGVETDFLAFADRATDLSATVDQAVSGREQQLAQAIFERVDGERRKVAEYLLVTRVAIARATDQLSLRDTDQ